MRIFQNEFLDKLTFLAEPHQAAHDLRVFGACLSIEQVSKILGISKRTIHAYESPKNPNRIPKQYFISLRFLSGDLSYFDNWDNCKIDPFSKRLKVRTDKYNDYSPDSIISKSFEIKHYATKKERAAEEKILFLKHLIKKYQRNQVVKEQKNNVIVVNKWKRH